MDSRFRGNDDIRLADDIHGVAKLKWYDYLGVTTQTVMRYYALVMLPEELKLMVDQGILSSGYAVQIVRNTYDGARVQRSQEVMRVRASWILGLERDSREYAIDAIRSLGHGASIAELTKYVSVKVKESSRIVQYAIPSELHDRLLEWGRFRGLDDESTIVGHMVADTLSRRSR